MVRRKKLLHLLLMPLLLLLHLLLKLHLLLLLPHLLLTQLLLLPHLLLMLLLLPLHLLKRSNYFFILSNKKADASRLFYCLLHRSG